MAKSADAFRTISEVADWLGVQTHVLRFWESKFSQIKPVKRAGGRRYYRPTDMLLIGGIRKLLHDDGLTIKGVQKILREEGNAYVSDKSHPLDDETDAMIDSIAEKPVAPDEKGNVSVSETPRDQRPFSPENVDVLPPSASAPPAEPIEPIPVKAPTPPPSFAPPPPDAQAAAQDLVEEALVKDSVPSEADDAESDQPRSDLSDNSVQAPQFRHTRSEDEEPEEHTGTPAPSFESASAPETKAVTVEGSSISPFDAGTEQQVGATPSPAVINVPDVPEDTFFAAEPSVLTKATRARSLSRTQREALRPLLDQLTALRDQMARTRRDSH